MNRNKGRFRFGAVAAATFAAVAIVIVLRAPGRCQESGPDAERPFGIRIYAWSDADCANAFDASPGVGAVVLTRESRKQPPHAAPKNWMHCDGALLKVADFPRLSRVLKRKFSLAGDAEGTFRLPGICGLRVYDWSVPGTLQVFSHLDYASAVDDALDEPDSDPKAQQAILELCENNPKDMLVVAYIRVREGN